MAQSQVQIPKDWNTVVMMWDTDKPSYCKADFKWMLLKMVL